MNNQTIINEMLESIKQYKTNDVEGILEVETPFSNHKGDLITICIEVTDDEVSITDDGQIINTLSLSGIEISDSKLAATVFKRLLKQYKVEYHDEVDELLITFNKTKDSYSTVLTNYIQALLAIDTIYFMLRT